MAKLKTTTLTLFTAALVALALFAASPAQARGAAIQNIENVPIPDGMSMKSIGDAIIDGCAARGWGATEVEAGHMQCTIYVRSHMAKVNINFDTETYSITYADSENLKYDAAKNTIHRNYNSWVQNLNGDLRNAMLRASR